MEKNNQRLEEIRKNLEEKFPDFPRGRCVDAVAEIKMNLGYEVVGGIFFLDPNDPNRGPYECHYWNFDPKTNRYIDLSADQFPTIAEKIFITNKGDPHYREFPFSLIHYPLTF